MSTSYANTGGTGDRRSIINVSINPAVFNLDPPVALLNGSVDNVDFFNNASVTSSTWIQFDFSNTLGPVVIDEAKWYQDNATSQGTWKWQGSNDFASWTDIGSSFTLGGATPSQTITALSGNTTAYVGYRLLGVSGSTSNSPWTQEIEFKIGAVSNPGTTATTSYANSGGTGNRTSIITATQSGTLVQSGPSAPNMPLMVNGNTSSDNTNFFSGGSVTSSRTITFDFTSIGSVVIDQVKWYQSTAKPEGYWKWQGSANNSSWTDIGWVFLLGNYSAATQTIGALVNNSNDYKYYRLIGSAGATDVNPFVQEAEFRLSSAISAVANQPCPFIIT